MLRDYTQELKDRQACREAARIAQCLALADNNPAEAAQIALRRGWDNGAQIHRALMAAVPGQTTSGDTGFIGVHSNNLLGVVRPRTIIGRMPAVQRVPFDGALTAMSGGVTSAWVGEGAPAPLSKSTFARLASPLGRLKNVAIAVESKELVRSGASDSQVTIGRNFAGACVAAADTAFIDPTSAAVANVRPASVTYGAPAFASGGSTALLIDADLGQLVESLLANGSTLEEAVWVIHPITAAFLARLRNVNGDYAYPGVTVLGGVLMGLPVIVSASVPHGGSPSIASIALVDASRIWLAEDDVMELAISEAGALEMLDNPTNDAAAGTPATTMVSLFQTNSIALRGTRTMNWKIADAGFAAVLNGLAD